MSSLTETTHAGEFILSEAPGNRSRDNVTVLSGQNLAAGAVVGKVGLGIGGASVPAVVGTGNGTMTLVSAGPEIQEGNYVVKCITAATDNGVFSVTAPDGTALPNATMTGGTCAYTSRHINFTLTDGGTDFIVNDTFTIVVGTTPPTVLGGTGTGTISAMTLGPDAHPGLYRLECVTAVSHGGVWQGWDPNGNSIGQFTMTPGSGGATAFTNRHLNFTLTDATDFIVGNAFNVAVYNKVTKKVVEWDPAPTAWDGRQVACGVLYEAVNASAADKAGVIVCRDAEVIKDALIWKTGTGTQRKASAYGDLAALGVIAR